MNEYAKEDIRQQGRDAWYDDIDETDCPYSADSQEAEMWLEGWWERQYDRWDQEESEAYYEANRDDDED